MWTWTYYHVIGVLLDKCVENLAAMGLQLNAQKTKVLTPQAQPPSQLQTPNGLTISVLDRESSHKAWMHVDDVNGTDHDM